MSFLRWLYPALGIKRWLALALLGILLTSAGIAVTLEGQFLGYLENQITQLTLNLFGSVAHSAGGILIILAGIALILFSFANAVRSLIRSAFPEAKGQMKNLYQRQYLRRGPRIVVIGGGTGLSVLLRGLKEYTSNITAIVSVTDDGGSSGRLRGQFGILPPGDLRNCLVALADTEPVMERLFNYRFQGGKELAGHNLGNLLITAMADMSGNFETAINEISKVMAIRGRVLPSTLDDVVLAAELQDGTKIMGESVISKTSKPIKKVFTIPEISNPLPEALEAIREADAIVFGPGSLYTSIIPNLLVPGIVEAIEKSEALKIYVCNVMTQPGETRDFTASDHLKALYRHSANGLANYIIVNDQVVPDYFSAKYALEGAKPVEIDREKLAKLNVKVLNAPLIKQSDYIRHDSYKLASFILRLVLDKRKVTPFFNIVDQYLLWDRIAKSE